MSARLRSPLLAEPPEMLWQMVRRFGYEGEITGALSLEPIREALRAGITSLRGPLVTADHHLTTLR